jgi:hypothetical protein
LIGVNQPHDLGGQRLLPKLPAELSWPAFERYSFRPIFPFDRDDLDHDSSGFILAPDTA